MSNTAFKSWFSDQTKEYEAFARARCNYTHVAPFSPVLPRTWSEWIKHRLFVQEETESQELRRIAIKAVMEKIQKVDEKHKSPFADKTFEDHLSSVLARESIWLPSYTAPPDRAQAPWPTRDEMKQEAKGRGKTRYLPLPRVPSKSTIDWKQRTPIEPFEFDEVGHFDAKKEIVPETDENMICLVGGYLLKELDH